MSLRVAWASLCLVLPLVSAISFPEPSPTQPSIHHTGPRPPAPKTTPPPRVTHRRRDDYVVNTITQTDSPELCGYYSADYFSSTIGCNQGYTCVYHRSETKYPGMLGCCSEETDCGFTTSCIPGSRVSQSPALTDTMGPFTLYCTESGLEECVTWSYPDMTLTDFGCDSTSGDIIDLYTWAWGTSTSGTWDLYDRYMSQVGADFVDTYSTTYTSGGSQNAHASGTASPSGTGSPGHNSNSHGTNDGAIAGGVVGGVAGVALIGAAGFFLGKRRKGKQAPGDAGGNDGAGPYTSVPDAMTADSDANTHGMMSEMESTEAARIAEVQGSTPADQVHEMQGTYTEGADTKKDFVAELPADEAFAPKK